jgi:hypothetical protein
VTAAKGFGRRSAVHAAVLLRKVAGMRDAPPQGDVGDGGAAAAEAVIGLGHRLGLRVVAEGVESEAVLDELIALGCDSAQGYAISPALTAEELEELYAAHHLAAITAPSDSAAGVGGSLAPGCGASGVAPADLLHRRASGGCRKRLVLHFCPDVDRCGPHFVGRSLFRDGTSHRAFRKAIELSARSVLAPSFRMGQRPVVETGR